MLVVKTAVGAGSVSVGSNVALAMGAIMAVGISYPQRVIQYQNGLTSMRVNYTADAASSGVKDALVFVRESWGAQITTRMWERGVSRSAAAALYHGVDACLLDKSLREVEQRGLRGSAAEQQLEPLLKDSSRVRSSPLARSPVMPWPRLRCLGRSCRARAT